MVITCYSDFAMSAADCDFAGEQMSRPAFVRSLLVLDGRPIHQQLSTL